jgi:hypothetical protein
MSDDVPQMSLNLPGTAIGTRSSFFFMAHAALFVLVLVGFAPTFFLRAFFDVPPIRASLYIHGTVLTLWFSLALAQGWLIGAGRVRWHRRLGYVAACYVALVVSSGFFTTARMAARVVSLDDPQNIIVWGNCFSLLMFAGFVSLAILLRRRPEAHKRLTLLASVAIIGPALGRFPTWPVFAGGLDAGKNFAIGGLLVLLGSMVVYDIVVRRKVHPATWGGGVAIVGSIAAAVALGLSPAGFNLLRGWFGE